jgi:hypothetical protein
MLHLGKSWLRVRCPPHGRQRRQRTESLIQEAGSRSLRCANSAMTQLVQQAVSSVQRAAHASGPVSTHYLFCSRATRRALQGNTDVPVTLTKRSRRIAACPSAAWPSPSCGVDHAAHQPQWPCIDGSTGIHAAQHHAPRRASGIAQPAHDVRCALRRWQELQVRHPRPGCPSPRAAAPRRRGWPTAMPRKRCSTSRHAVSRSRKPLATGV